jgi:hypothetical protein
MTLLTNDDFANRELSIEELDAIAAGSVWGWIKHEANSVANFFESRTGKQVLVGVGEVALAGLFLSRFL